MKTTSPKKSTSGNAKSTKGQNKKNAAAPSEAPKTDEANVNADTAATVPASTPATKPASTKAPKKAAAPKASTKKTAAPKAEAAPAAEPAAPAVPTNKTKDATLKSVDPRNIVVVPDFNVRKDMGDLDSLLASILEIGLETPLKAEKMRGKDQWELVEGHRRLAAIMLGLERGHDIPFVTVIPFTGTAEEKILTMIATGVGQKQLNEIEQADGIARLVKFDYKPEEIASKVGLSVAHVYNLMKIASMPKSVKNHIAAGKIAATAVVNLARVEKDPTKLAAAVNEAVKNVRIGKNGVAKKATSGDIVALKKLPLERKLLNVFEELKNGNVKNAKTEVLTALLVTLKDSSVEDIVAYFTAK